MPQSQSDVYYPGDNRSILSNIAIINNGSEIPSALFQYFLQFTDEEKRQRILQQKSKTNADNMLIGDILTKYMIKKHFGIPFALQRIEYENQGKPYLVDYPGVHFSISHSGGFVACAVADRPVGIDIQKLSRYNAAVARRYYSPEQADGILSSTDRDKEFTKLWAQKEAYIKMLGRGLCGNTTLIPCGENEFFWHGDLAVSVFYG